MTSVTNVAPVAQDTHAKASFYGDLIDYTDDEHDTTEDDTSEGEESESGKSADEESLTGTAIARSPLKCRRKIPGTTGFSVTKDADHHGAIVNLTRSDEVFVMSGPRDQLHAMIDGKPARLLFVHAVSRPGKKWVYEDDGKEAHRSFIRVAREAGSGPLNLGHEIQKRAVVNQLSGDLVKRLLTFQVEAASSEQVPFVLIAAVCYRNESTPVRIRLFTGRGVEFPPHYKATYNGSDWEIGAVGHTYFMLHVQSNIQVTKTMPHMHNIITGRVSGTHKHVVGDEKRHRLPRNEEDHLVVAKRRRAE
ncbi:uncharacterized protein CCOS01_15544 [Colletotrichum costaricense]|uniref:Uncharacterized protein n=1 Tax=Colletotrichum costaricense TaxID=1209916 RepID=A0AAJ0DTK3_9PEZI|nr:uncharacterized protein CCOS01_15544 [Colletotrichum costaricense]KAK1509450.1 hypothetical protein CCOS01_15544 [Colletotrichum costaricense]